MKISDFNIEDLKKMKQACIDTRAKYDGYSDHKVPGRNNCMSCPLCQFTKQFCADYSVTCCYCPHMVIENATYDTFAFVVPCENSSYSTQKAMTRRKRLDRWIKLIDEEIRRRG